jgi:hypothetical protein
MPVSRPSSTTDFATTANYSAGTDPWSGTPRRVQPSSGDRAAGFTPNDRPPAQWLNHLLGLCADWTKWLSAIIDTNEEHTYQTAKARKIILSAGVVWAREVAGAFDWRADTGYYESLVDSGTLAFDVSAFLPTDAVLTKVEVLVDPGAARSGNDRMRLIISRGDHGAKFTTPAAPGYTTLDTAYDDASANAQVIASATLSETIDRDTNVIVGTLNAGNTGLANADKLYGIRLSFDDVGPRNA